MYWKKNSVLEALWGTAGSQGVIIAVMPSISQEGSLRTAFAPVSTTI
jgi:hypothetical protein